MNNKNSNKILKFFLFSGFLLLIFSNCERLELDKPPIQSIDQDSIITIKELRNMFEDEPVNFGNSGFNIFGIVTMDESSGNIYREAFVQDDDAGIILRMTQTGEFQEGDSVRISLRGTILNDYRSMLQLTELDGTKNVVVQAKEKHLDPLLLTIPEITRQYQGMLVKLENVQFSLSHAGQPYANAEDLQAINRTIEDDEGNSIIVRTSGYADFASELTPEGSGSLIGLVGEHDNQMQLFIRRTAEVVMEQERFEPPGSDLELLTIAQIKEMYDNGIENLPPNTRIEGIVISDREHENLPGQNAYIMDENNDGIALRFQSWHSLDKGSIVRISSGELPITRFNGLLQVSEIPVGNAIVLDFGEVPEPTVVTIQELKNNFGQYESTLIKIQNAIIPGGGTFQGNVSVQDNTGSIMMFTTSWASFANTTVTGGIYDITAIASIFNSPQILIRSLDDLEFIDDYDPGGTGSGTFEDPYNVAYAYNNNSGDGVWVQGYIIGVMETDVDPFAPNFNPPFRTNSNIIIADSPGETNMNQALIVQLPVGPVRNALNLVDNPQRLGEFVKLKGNLAAYFGVPGLRETSDFWIDGDIPPEINTVFEENFTSDLGVFSNYNISGNENWQWVHFNDGSASMNGFVAGSPRENENWLISPEINLEGETGAILRISETINFITSYEDMKVMIASDFDGSNPTESGNWIHLTGFNRPPGNNWNVVESGDIDISQFDGQIIHLAFKYISTTGGAAAWQISQITIVADE